MYISNYVFIRVLQANPYSIKDAITYFFLLMTSPPKICMSSIHNDMPPTMPM